MALKGLLHLRRHTLRERLQWRWRQRIRRKRLAWWQSQAGNRQVEVRIQAGLRMQLYPDCYLSRLIYCEDYEPSERDFLKRFLKPGDIFVDIGANIGLYTVLAGRYVGERGHVYAFEPCAKTYQRLLANVKLNKLANVSCCQTALSDHSGCLDLTVSLDGFDACNSFSQPVFGEQFASERVATIAWDEFAGEHSLVGRVAMMKIDVEGWETYVVEGGARTLARDDAPILQVEFNDQSALPAGTSGQRLYRTLGALGYQMSVYDAKAQTLTPHPVQDSYPWLNLIAAKRPSHVIARLRGTIQ